MIGETGVFTRNTQSFGPGTCAWRNMERESVSGQINKGEKIRVTGIKNLKLYVESAQYLN